MPRDTVQLEILVEDKNQLDDLALNLCEVTGLSDVSDYDVVRFAINALERELHYVTNIHVDNICKAYDKVVKANEKEVSTETLKQTQEDKHASDN